MKRGRPQPLCIYAQFKSDGRATIRQKHSWVGGVLRVESREYVPGGSGDQVSAAATAQKVCVPEKGALALKLSCSCHFTWRRRYLIAF